MSINAIKLIADPFCRNESMHQDIVSRTTTARIPTPEGTFQLSHYIDSRNGKEHLALIMGNVEGQDNILVRVHSECFTGDVLGSQRCDCGEQLHQAMRRVAQEGQGVILYLRQEGRGIGLAEKLKAYNLQDQGYDTVDANLKLGHQADEREYGAAAAILADLGIASIRLMTNNPTKLEQLQALGVKIKDRQPLHSTVTQHNVAYLATKIQRMRHLLTLPIHATNSAPNGNGHLSANGTSDSKLISNNIAAIQTRLYDLQQRAHLYHAQTGLPYITLSYAQTLDGTIGATDVSQLRISGSESLLVTHRVRAAHDAILVGIGTLLADNPQLTVRLVEGENPQPIIVDSHLRIPSDARIFAHPKAPWIATLNAQAARAVLLREQGATIHQLPATPQGQVDLLALFTFLGTQGIRSVMVEGGANIINTLLRERLANHAIVTIAPRYEAGIRINHTPAPTLATLTNPTYTQAGQDIILWGEMAWSLTPEELSASRRNISIPTPSTSAATQPSTR